MIIVERLHEIPDGRLAYLGQPRPGQPVNMGAYVRCGVCGQVSAYRHDRDWVQTIHGLAHYRCTR